jgi:ankyrin repeat protein
LRYITAKYPHNLHGFNERGEHALDIAIQLGHLIFIGMLLDSKGLLLSTKYENNFIDIIIRSGRIKFLRTTIERELDENQTTTLLKYIHGRFAQFLPSISEGNLEYCAHAKNCSDLITIPSDWIVLEVNRRNEKS